MGYSKDRVSIYQSIDARETVRRLRTEITRLRQIIKKSQEDKKALRRVESILKMWASIINPDYKMIYAEIKRVLALRD
ncbi:hypothetical protein LCGC14_2072570 [marine sediment metagenome]|uniref:Uncharacterized protein n=1 Tax=marine sediment metagenome TaxID=412755 RepID=A0A0F9GWA6_9ZZZZ